MGQTGSINGNVRDSSTRDQLSLATITVFDPSDTSLITYRLSDQNGVFKVPGLPVNKPLRVVISFAGYNPLRKVVTLQDNQPLLLDTIYLSTTSKTLDEVLILAERPPVIVKKDTIEFNASAFKTLPTALVEDLLRKLPGVQVDGEGSIFVNGKRVNRILVDGKRFFGNDPKLATRNLPANVIEKVQVADDGEERDRNMDGNLSELGKVINLQLKKGVKKGAFGKVYAGIGSDDRNEVGAIGNIFRDTLQLSLLGYTNNINRSGFTIRDVNHLGGFGRSGINSLSITKRNGATGFSVNDISFGGLEEGLARSSGAGFNLNHVPSKKVNFYLQYFYGNSKNEIETVTNNQQYINDTVVTTRVNAKGIKDLNTHRVNFGMNLNPDDLTNVRFQAGGNFLSSEQRLTSITEVGNNKLAEKASGTGAVLTDVSSGHYSHDFNLTRKSGSKEGRVLNVSQTLSYNSDLTRITTETRNSYPGPAEDTVLFEQLRRKAVPVLNINTRVGWVEKLSTTFSLRWNTFYEYLSQKQDISLFDKNFVTGKYTLPIDEQNNNLRRRQHRFGSDVSLSYNIKDLTDTAGGYALWQNISNDYLKGTQPVDFKLFNLLPKLSIDWKGIFLQYRKNVIVPELSYLIPVQDSSSPFFIVYGNPLLNPATMHSANANYFKSFQKSNLSLNFFAGTDFIDDDVIMSRVVDANGVQSVIPVNVDGSRNYHFGAGLFKDFKRNNLFTFSVRLDPSLSVDKSKIIVNSNESFVRSTTFMPRLSFGFNWSDLVEIRPAYVYQLKKTAYTDSYFSDIQVVTHNFLADVFVRWPAKFTWQTNVNYRYNGQVAEGLPKDNMLWNAAVAYSFMKSEKLQLQLSVYDILNRNNNFTRTVMENYTLDRQVNILQRYVLLTATYNFNSLGSEKSKRDRLFLF